MAKKIDNTISSLNNKIAANKSKFVSIENKLKKLKLFDSSYFIEEDDTQNYLVSQPIKEHFKVVANTDYVSSWKSKGLSAETFKPPTTSDNSLTPSLSYYDAKIRVKFTGSCLKQLTISYNHRPIVNIYIVYELSASGCHIDYPTLKRLFIWCSHFD